MGAGTARRTTSAQITKKIDELAVTAISSNDAPAPVPIRDGFFTAGAKVASTNCKVPQPHGLAGHYCREQCYSENHFIAILWKAGNAKVSCYETDGNLFTLAAASRRKELGSPSYSTGGSLNHAASCGLVSFNLTRMLSRSSTNGMTTP